MDRQEGPLKEARATPLRQLMIADPRDGRKVPERTHPAIHQPAGDCGQSPRGEDLVAAPEQGIHIGEAHHGITKCAALHRLRHSFAKPLPGAGSDVRGIEVLLDHAKLSTTARDTHVATGTIRDTISPCELQAKLRDRTVKPILQ